MGHWKLIAMQFRLPFTPGWPNLWSGLCPDLRSGFRVGPAALNMVQGLGWAGILVWNGCSGSDSTSADDEIIEEDPHALDGTWTTTGTDDRYGDASVRMQMKEDGDLVVTAELAAGGTLRFAGGWETQEQTLVLTGTYFEPG